MCMQRLQCIFMYPRSACLMHVTCEAFHSCHPQEGQSACTGHCQEVLHPIQSAAPVSMSPDLNLIEMQTHLLWRGMEELDISRIFEIVLLQSMHRVVNEFCISLCVSPNHHVPVQTATDEDSETPDMQGCGSPSQTDAV